MGGVIGFVLYRSCGTLVERKRESVRISGSGGGGGVGKEASLSMTLERTVVRTRMRIIPSFTGREF